MDAVWAGKKVHMAFTDAGYDDTQRRIALNERPDIKSYLVELSMVRDVGNELCTTQR
jgi:hypothetical protein